MMPELAPWQWALGVFCAGVLAWSLYVRLFTSSHPAGWTSVIAIVLLLGGVQMLSLGVIGQYIARIFDESKQRPLYFVEEIVEGGHGWKAGGSGQAGEIGSGDGCSRLLPAGHFVNAVVEHDQRQILRPAGDDRHQTAQAH